MRDDDAAITDHLQVRQLSGVRLAEDGEEEVLDRGQTVEDATRLFSGGRVRTDGPRAHVEPQLHLVTDADNG